MKKTDGEFLVLLGKKIKERREAIGLSLLEVGDKSGLNKGQASKIERGEHSSTITVLRKIAIALDISLSEMFDF